MADAQDLKIHFTLFQPVAHHRLPHAQTIDNKWVSSVHAFFHSVAKGRGSDPKSSTKSSTDTKQTPKYLLKSCASGKGISPRLVPVSSSGLLKAEGQAECQHANAPPRQVPGRVVIVARIAPHQPSQHWRKCRHHQGRACARLSALGRNEGYARLCVPSHNPLASRRKTSSLKE
jgi:hypothetical protein